LIHVRETAQAAGLTEIVSKFENIESLPAPQIGVRVVTAMALLQDQHQYRAIATQLEMVAMNLKNLK
jgi:hypothetical protein